MQRASLEFLDAESWIRIMGQHQRHFTVCSSYSSSSGFSWTAGQHSGSILSTQAGIAGCGWLLVLLLLLLGGSCHVQHEQHEEQR